MRCVQPWKKTGWIWVNLATGSRHMDGNMLHDQQPFEIRLTTEVVLHDLSMLRSRRCKVAEQQVAVEASQLSVTISKLEVGVLR